MTMRGVIVIGRDPGLSQLLYAGCQFPMVIQSVVVEVQGVALFDVRWVIECQDIAFQAGYQFIGED